MSFAYYPRTDTARNGGSQGVFAPKDLAQDGAVGSATMRTRSS